MKTSITVRIITVIALLAMDTSAFASAKDAPSAAPALPARVMLFNLAPGRTYQVRRNNVLASTPAADPDGVLAYETALNSGDRFVFTLEGTDVTPPAVSQRMPAPNATSVPRNTGVYFIVTDTGSGIDDASISVTIDDQSRPFVTHPTAGGLAVQCIPPTELAPDSDIPVHISVADAALPANVTTSEYSFRTGASVLDDTSAPLLSPVSPSAGAQGADPRPVIEVRLRDGGLGVSLASIVMEVNGVAVPYTLSGNPGDAQLRYQPPNDFPAGATVSVHVEGCDIAASPNCATVLDYEFSVAARTAMLSGQGAIVPDGYWANDPARPLEVRNLPVRWSVRIFNPAGLAVRTHENDSEGATWSWNFRNDQGQNVAPALYLVRVTDASGAVQRSGRFLVQSRR